MGLSIKQKQTPRHREQTCSCQGGGGRGGKDRARGINRCKLLYVACANSKVLLHSTGNYVQHPVINRNGKEYIFKKNVYTCVTVTLLYNRDWRNIVNQLYFNFKN